MVISVVSIGAVMYMVRPTPPSKGEKADPTTWPTDITTDCVSQTDTSDQALASDLNFATGKKPRSADQSVGLTFVWKDTSERALSEQNVTPNGVSWTDLDLTSYTSSNAKIAYLLLTIHVDTIGAGIDSVLKVRKNGTGYLMGPMVRVPKDGATVAGEYHAHAAVGMDSNQTIEHYIDPGAGWQADFYIDVLGYWE